MTTLREIKKANFEITLKERDSNFYLTVKNEICEKGIGFTDYNEALEAYEKALKDNDIESVLSVHERVYNNKLIKADKIMLDIPRELMFKLMKSYTEDDLYSDIDFKGRVEILSHFLTLKYDCYLSISNIIAMRIIKNEY